MRSKVKNLAVEIASPEAASKPTMALDEKPAVCILQRSMILSESGEALVRSLACDSAVRIISIRQRLLAFSLVGIVDLSVRRRIQTCHGFPFRVHTDATILLIGSEGWVWLVMIRRTATNVLGVL